MADLTDLQSAQTVKIAGADPTTGIETGFVPANGNSELRTTDGLAVGGVYGQITVGTTAIELKAGVSKYLNRKLVTVDNTSSSTIYWGYDSSVTISNYAGRIFKDQQASWQVATNNVSIFLIAGSAGNICRCSEGG